MSASQHEFLERLIAVLERLQPPALDRSASELTSNHPSIYLKVAHGVRPPDSLGLDVSDDEIIVNFGSEHLHFARRDVETGLVWPFEQGHFLTTAVYFVEQLLTGRIRLESVRRPFQIKTRAYWLNPDGAWVLFLRGGTILPVLGWSRAPEVERITFMQTGSGA